MNAGILLVYLGKRGALMVLDIGSDTAVSAGKVLMILDLTRVSPTEHQSLFEHAKKQGRLSLLPGSKPKSAVIVACQTERADQSRIILTPVSAQTLLKRDGGYAWLLQEQLG